MVEQKKLTPPFQLNVTLLNSPSAGTYPRFIVLLQPFVTAANTGESSLCKKENLMKGRWYCLKDKLAGNKLQFLLQKTKKRE